MVELGPEVKGARSVATPSCKGVQFNFASTRSRLLYGVQLDSLESCQLHVGKEPKPTRKKGQLEVGLVGQPFLLTHFQMKDRS